MSDQVPFRYRRSAQTRDVRQGLATIVEVSRACLYDVAKGDQNRTHIPNVLCWELSERYSDSTVGEQSLYGDLVGAVVAVDEKAAAAAADLVAGFAEMKKTVDDVATRVAALEKPQDEAAKPALLERIETCEANLRALRATIVAVDAPHSSEKSSDAS